MRIISGMLGGRRLRTLGGSATRPAMGKAREALFSMLDSRGVVWAETRVLDLYAGTGSLAFESISRGAPIAVMVDNGRNACRCLGANASDLGVTDRCRIVCGDALKFLRRNAVTPFDLVFIDPPYRHDCATPALAALVERGWLVPGAFVSMEVERDARITTPPGLELLTGRFLGQTSLTIHQWCNERKRQSESSPLSGDF